jgi:hypothetical protein
MIDSTAAQAMSAPTEMQSNVHQPQEGASDTGVPVAVFRVALRAKNFACSGVNRCAAGIAAPQYAQRFRLRTATGRSHALQRKGAFTLFMMRRG